MKTTKTVTITLTFAELLKSLESFQKDMIAEMFRNEFDIHKENLSVEWKAAAAFAFVCTDSYSNAFCDMVKRTATPWVNRPTSYEGWITLLEKMPGMFIKDARESLTDIVDSGAELKIFVSDYVVSTTTLLKNIWFGLLLLFILSLTEKMFGEAFFLLTFL